MFYLLWTILNIGIFIFLILVCVKTFKAIKERVGLIAAIVFVLGVISLMGFENANKDAYKNESAATWNFNNAESTESYSRKFATVVLANNLISKYVLDIYYGKRKEDLSRLPISAYSFSSGLRSGTKWIPSSVLVNTTDDERKFQYIVDGVVEWRLMGFLIYSQSKTFSGTAVVK